MVANIPRYIVWSTELVDNADPFQHRWLLRQILMYGRAKDIRLLNFDEIERELKHLNLPREVESLWRVYLEWWNGRK